MIPPTPTPMPPGSSLFDIPYAYGLWGSSSSAIQTWNWSGDWGRIVQSIMLVATVLAGVVIVTLFIKIMTRKDAED